jgi:hypothetical protein
VTKHLSDSRQVIDKLDAALNPGSPSKAGEGDLHADSLLQHLEDRVNFGNRLVQFYQRYNPERIQYLASMIDRYINKEEELCAEMRKKYSADFYGEYPREPPPEEQQAHGANSEDRGDRGPAPQQNDKARGAMVMDEGAVHRQIFASRLINFYSIHDPSLMSTVDEKVRVAFMLYL